MESMEQWDKKYTQSSNHRISSGWLGVVVSGLISVYFLHFLYQIKRDCPGVHKLTRQIGEVLLWIQVTACALMTIAGIYALMH